MIHDLTQYIGGEVDIDAAPVERRSPTRGQLDGDACIDCGRSLDGLVDAGYVGRLGLRVKACRDCARPGASLRVEAEWELPDGERRDVAVDSEQLNGRACVQCGSRLDGLLPAGCVYTSSSDGGRLPWPVKACPHHTREEAVL